MAEFLAAGACDRPRIREHWDGTITFKDQPLVTTHASQFPSSKGTTAPQLAPAFGELQTGMHGAFGKPQGTVARIHIGQVIIMSIRTKLQNKEIVIEALRRAKFKFPGLQKIHISKKWGFTKFNADEFEDMVAEKRLVPDGCGVKYIPNRGPLDKWRALHS
ncbi:60S ribosomal protein L10 [Cricetulus griseus]|nr:60S ribosomal protein L10 [Cricetulus griseus]